MEQTPDLKKQALLLHTKGNNLVKRGKFDDALKSYDAALEINSQSEKTLLQKARLLFDLKRYSESALALDRILEIDSKNVEALVERGSVFDVQGLSAEALSYFSKAVEISPHNIMARRYLGRKLTNMGECDRAIQIIDDGLKIDACDDELLYLKGFALQKSEKYREALDFFDRAISANPKNTPAKFRKFLVSIRFDKTEKPFELFWDAVDDDPRGMLSIIGYSLESAPENGFFWYVKAVILHEYMSFIGSKEEALAAISCAIEIDPDDAFNWFYKGSILQCLGRNEEASQSMKQAQILEKELPLESQ